jgi:hypothetical protein
MENISMWSGVEMNVSIICASLTVLRPFVLRYFNFNFLASVASNGSQARLNRKASLAVPGYYARAQSVETLGTRTPRLQDEERGIRVERGWEMTSTPAYR